LIEQLAPGGRLVVPVGPPESQTLTRVVRQRSGELRTEAITEVRFVPLIGEGGWPERPEHGSRGPSSTR
jgi:protein-L-isoaspartate(D-aspartate) O-methyltransferase